eukprot:scaffold56805_cov100-Phaeocystis_antarctica.AAC.1
MSEEQRARELAAAHDSEGRLTFTNAAFQVHLQTLLREVEELMAVQYMEVDAFSVPPPPPPGAGGGGESTATTAKWNGKSSASATATCHAFNGGHDHQADHHCFYFLLLLLLLVACSASLARLGRTHCSA